MPLWLRENVRNLDFESQAEFVELIRSPFVGLEYREFCLLCQFEIILEELAGQLRSAIQKDDRCQTYHRLLRWMIFSPEWMVSQIHSDILQLE